MDTSTEHHHLLQGISIPREWGVISWSSSGGPVFLSHSGSPRNLWAFWILGLQVASLCKKNNNRHNLYKKKKGGIKPAVPLLQNWIFLLLQDSRELFLPSGHSFPGAVMGTSGSWSFHSSSAPARPELHDLFLPLLIKGVSLSWKTDTFISDVNKEREKKNK